LVLQDSTLILSVRCDGHRCHEVARLSRRNDSHLPGSARHLVRKLRLRRIRMAIWSVEGGSDGSTHGHLGQNREASTWARRR
ncbi:hypothetical protein T12_14418, partial [Trichinella patagoniensis]